jgi:hypothetical protein
MSIIDIFIQIAGFYPQAIMLTAVLILLFWRYGPIGLDKKRQSPETSLSGRTKRFLKGVWG